MHESPFVSSNRGNTNKLFAVFVNIFFVLSLISLYQWVMHNMINLGSNSSDWALFEILTNYEAGFIRRGLMGEIFYWIAAYTHLDIRVLMAVFLIPPWLFVAGFMIGNFRKYGIRWWLLAIIGFGMLSSVFRKDFIVYTLFIALLYSYRSKRLVSVRISVMSLVSVLVLLTYEPAMFMCLGFLALLVLRDKTLPKWARAAYPAVLCLTMLVLLRSTGGSGVGSAIYNSWLGIFPQGFNISDNVINSLDWSVGDSFRYNTNLLMPEFNLLFLIRYIFFIVAIPYIYISYVYTDTFPNARKFPYSPATFTTLFLFFMLCMLPMWAGLSCDYGRMLYQATLSSLCVAFILPEKVAVSAFPQWALNIGGKIDRMFRRIPRSIYSITLLTLIFTPGYSFYYTPEYSLKIDSLLIRVMGDTGDFLHIIISHIFH